MTDYVTFSEFITKGIEVEKNENGKRIFKGHITAEVIDRQNEFIFVKEVLDIMKTFMEVNPVISDFHSNRMVGRVLDYEQSEYQGVPTVLITGEVYKKDGVTLYDKVWEKVVKGEYAGLSMGGASKEREPIIKNGKTALELRKLELYEIALCTTPANPFAVIESVNTFAKAVGLDQEMIQEENGREFIKCHTLQCCFEKGTNREVDVDIDNNDEDLEQFDKPEDELEKGETLVGRAAVTRSEAVGMATTSPKQINDQLKEIPHIKNPLKKYDEKQLEMGIKVEMEHTNDPTVAEQIARDHLQEVPDYYTRLKEYVETKKDHIPGMAEEKEEEARKKNEVKKDDLLPPVNALIKLYGADEIRKALQQHDTVLYLKNLYKKYDL